MRITLSQQGLVLILVPLALEIAFTFMLLAVMQQSQHEVAREERARQVAMSFNRISRYMMAEAAGIMMANPGGKGGSNHASLNIPPEFERLQNLTKDNPTLLAYVNTVKDRWEEGQRQMHDVKILAEDNPAAILVAYSRLKKIISSIYLSAEEAANYAQATDALVPSAQIVDQARIRLLIIGFLAFNIITAVVLWLTFNKRTNARLRVLITNAQAMAMDRPVFERLEGSDELTELQRVLLTMSSSLAQARTKERAVLDNAADIICSIDEKGVFVTASSAVQNLWHCDESDVLGRRLADIILEEDFEKTRRLMEEIRETGTTRTIENRVKTGAGQVVDVQWSITWSRDENNYICVVHDITERRHLERMRQDFLNMITHDIRTPLSSVQAFLNLLESSVYGQLNEKGSVKLKATEQSVELVIRLIKDMLDLEKAESGQLMLDLEDTSTQTVMLKAIDIVKPLAEQKNIELKPTGTDLPITVDQGRIVQVLVNLCGNAIKFAPAGTAVTLYSQMQGNKPTISVTDQGPGIKAEDQKRIFNKFEQVSAADATARGGTGLGLAIARVLVENHGGKLTVQSDGRSGTTFTVTFAG
ncbi:MAG: PAS domain S-box protein [Cyanobacteria bacterium SZAS LIN-3]|nr:PAS domain S-box protein [Cyanobacteria bacterium SZAS LIN-3]